MPNFSTLLTKDNITAVAIGHFDGVHRGHKELLKRLGEYGGLVVIDKNKANITPGLKRAEYSRYPCFLYDFDSIKGLGGDEFIALLIFVSGETGRGTSMICGAFLTARWS